MFKLNILIFKGRNIGVIDLNFIWGWILNKKATSIRFHNKNLYNSNARKKQCSSFTTTGLLTVKDKTCYTRPHYTFAPPSFISLFVIMTYYKSVTYYD
jgi:hypothetical protein